LCACFVSIGWYSLALSIAQDKKLRQTIRDKVRDESKLLDNIGTAQMEQEAQNKVMKIVREYEQSMKEQSGIPSSMQDNDIRVYMEQILQEVKQRKV
jgi:Tfp pilus assembly PilM family ATPase